MTAPKNPRITITPEAFKLLSVQAALQGQDPGELASQLIQKSCKMAMTAIEAIEKGKDKTSEGEREKGIEGEKCGTPIDAGFEANTQPQWMKQLKTSRTTKENIFAGLRFMVGEWEAGREPTPEQVSKAAGVDSRPLDKVLSQIGVKSQGKIKHYPMSCRPQAEKILQEGLPK